MRAFLLRSVRLRRNDETLPGLSKFARLLSDAHLRSLAVKKSFFKFLLDLPLVGPSSTTSSGNAALILASVLQNFTRQAFNLALPLLAVTQWGVSGTAGTWQVLHLSGSRSGVKGVELAGAMYCSYVDHPYEHIGLLTQFYFWPASSKEFVSSTKRVVPIPWTAPLSRMRDTAVECRKTNLTLN